jgi:hypothetical protein
MNVSFDCPEQSDTLCAVVEFISRVETSAQNGPEYTGTPYRSFSLFLNFIPAFIFSKNTYWYGMFLNNGVTKCGVEKIKAYTVLPMKVVLCCYRN